MLENVPLPKEKQKEKHNRKQTNQHKKFIEQKGSNDYSLSGDINPITRLYQIERARSKKIHFTNSENLLSKINSDLLKSIVISLPPPPRKGSLKRDENSNKQQQEKKHVHFIED